MKPLVIIPARGGSKRLPGKNIKLLNGKPLIHYTIEAAREVFDDSVICVSTDDDTIKNVAERTGLKIPFERPASLSTDEADTNGVLKHAFDYYKNIRNYNADTIVLLQPTSPLRTAKHIRDCLSLYNGINVDCVVSVKNIDLNLNTILKESNKGYLGKLFSEKTLSKLSNKNMYKLNGAIYIFNEELLNNNKGLISEKTRKYLMNDKQSIDIDTLEDFKDAEYILDGS